MNILVTGGAGYVGSILVNYLLHLEGAEKITVYDNLSARYYGLFTFSVLNSAKIKFIEGDILDAPKLKREVKDADVVFHLAALTSKDTAIDSHAYEQNNHWGTSEVLNAVEQADVKKFIYLSSESIFGSGIIANESIEPEPQSFYAHSKYRAEEQIRRIWDKKQCFIVRSAEIFGFSPASHYKSMLNQFVFQAHFKGRIQIPGNGRNRRSFVSIAKVAATLASFIHTESPSAIFHLADYNLQVLDIVDTLQELYSELEFIFINPHLQLQDLALMPSEKLNSFSNLKTNSLKAELADFRSHFSFAKS